MAEFEIGVIEGNVISIAWRAVKTVFRTWWFCRKNGLPHNKWYGVYRKGTELKIAEMGCLPAAKYNAEMLMLGFEHSPDKCNG